MLRGKARWKDGGQTCDHGDAHVRAQAIPPAGGAHPQPLGVIVSRALGCSQQSAAHLLTCQPHDIRLNSMQMHSCFWYSICCKPIC